MPRTWQPPRLRVPLVKIDPKLETAVGIDRLVRQEND